MTNFGSVILADTVGFIRHLPHKLVQAFQATLEESAGSDLLLHVIDSHDPERQENIDQVVRVLEEIDAHELPRLDVYNKIDLMPGVVPRIDRDEQGCPCRVWISAVSGQGLELLCQAVAELLAGNVVHGYLSLGLDNERLRARLYAMGVVQSETHDDKGRPSLEIRMPRDKLVRLLNQEGIAASALRS